MKKITALAAGVGIALALLFAPPAQAGVREDKLFYSLVTGDAPTLKGVSRQQLVKTAKETCKFLRAGFTIMDAYDMMDESGFTNKEITVFLAGAVVFYCPDQEDNY
jgi:hypothetical protein